MIREKWQVDQQYKENCMEVLVENLAVLRAKAGITQEELANVIGVSRQTYQGKHITLLKRSVGR